MPSQSELAEDRELYLRRHKLFGLSTKIAANPETTKQTKSSSAKKVAPREAE